MDDGTSPPPTAPATCICVFRVSKGCVAKRATKPLTPPATASCGMDIAGGAGASPAGSEASSDPIDARPGARRCVSSYM